MKHLVNNGIVQIRDRLLRFIYLQIAVFVPGLKIKCVHSKDIPDLHVTFFIFVNMVTYISQSL